jgi:hypothetical protein
MKRLRFVVAAAAVVALCAATAALGGSGVGDTFNLGKTNTVNVQSILTGTLATPAAMLNVRNGSSKAGSFGLLGDVTSANAPSTSAGVRGAGSGNARGVWGSQSTGIGVYGSAAAGDGVRGHATTGTGVSGIHSASSGADPAVSGETNSTDFQSAGVYGADLAGIGAGVKGVASNGIGVYSLSSSGTALRAHSDSGDGISVDSNTGTGIVAGGNVFGIFVESNGANGAAIDASTTAPDADGVVGFGQTGRGVSGHSTTGTGVDAYSQLGDAVYAETSSGYAGYFVGDVHSTGVVSAPTKNFRIDDPLDPAHKYLQHSSVESPDMMDLYNGNVTTDRRGFATIRMPKWFQALNRRFRYQLTIVGKRGWNARVVKPIAQNRFTIQSDEPRVKVSWQVTGVRHDKFANAHRTQVILPKSAGDQGKYIYPQGYGKPRSDTVGYQAPKRVTR